MPKAIARQPARVSCTALAAAARPPPPRSPPITVCNGGLSRTVTDRMDGNRAMSATMTHVAVAVSRHATEDRNQHGEGPLADMKWADLNQTL
jgi:hypothetical protein